MSWIILSLALSCWIPFPGACCIAQETSIPDPLQASATTYLVDRSRFLQAVPRTDGGTTPKTVLGSEELSIFEKALKKHKARLVVRASNEGAVGTPLVLGGSRKKDHVGDVDVEIGESGQVTATKVQSVIQWGTNATLETEWPREDAATLRIQAHVRFCALAGMKTSRVGKLRVEHPCLSLCTFDTVLDLEPGEAALFAGITPGYPDHVLLLILEVRSSRAASAGSPPEAEEPVNATAALWLFASSKSSTRSLARACTRKELSYRDAYDRVQKNGDVVFLGLGPALAGTMVSTRIETQRTYIESWDEEMAGGRSAWDPVVGTCRTGVDCSLTVSPGSSTINELRFQIETEPGRTRTMPGCKRKVADLHLVTKDVANSAPMLVEKGNSLFDVGRLGARGRGILLITR